MKQVAVLAERKLRERARPVAPRDTSAEIGCYVVHKPGF